MREYVSALELLELALVHKKKPLTEEQRQHVERLIVRCRAFIATYDVELVPADAEVKVNGSPGKLESGALLLDPGEHEIVVRADGYRSLTRKVHAEGGKRGKLELRLKRGGNDGTAVAENPAGAVDERLGGTPVEPEPATIGERSDAGPGRLWTWVAAGSAVALAGTAALFWALGSGEYSDVEEVCKQTGCPNTKRVNDVITETNLETYETLTTVSLVLSGAALVTAGVLFFVEAPSDEETEPVTVGLGPGGVQLGGRF
jgi:hypothetical protein